MYLFYAPDIQGLEYTLSEDESKHCTRVLRLSEGDSVCLVDGKGGFYTAVISSATGKRCTVRIESEEKNFGKRSYHLHVAMAPTKSIDRYEWFLEKATEIGVDELTPLVCEHSERRQVKGERLEKVVEAAIKQSLKAYCPQVHPLTDFACFVEYADADVKLIAHCADGEKPLLSSLLKVGAKTLIMVGPEGDFSPVEVALAKRYGFQEVSLGASRLRTETAGVVACAAAAVANGAV